MVIIYSISVRFRDGGGHSYTIVGYYLTRAQAIQKAHEYFHKRGKLSSADKIIVQELSIGPQGAGIRLIDWINY